MMKEIIKKYANNILTPSEVSELQQQLDKMSDIEIAYNLQEDWFSKATDQIFVDDSSRLRKMKRVIDERLSTYSQTRGIASTKSHRWSIALLKWFSLAAAILLPLMLFSTIYFYQQMTAESRKTVTFLTQRGEKVSIVLPDGTKVTMNHNSRLVYFPARFGTNKREIAFDGDAYFEVTHNKKSPFMIRQQELSVQVLGTNFCLRARKSDKMAKLSLDKGLVSLKAERTGESQLVRPGEMAELTYKTGHITIAPKADKADISVWRREEMKFKDASLQTVIHELEECYDVCFAGMPSHHTDHFTGSLPTHSMDSALRILKIAYGFNYSIKGNVVIINK